MKKFIRKAFIHEDLAQASTEPSSPAALQAKRLGLQYVGFGRYEDPRTQQVTHIVQNDRLVPFSKAVRTNNYQQYSSNDIGDFAKGSKKNASAIGEHLRGFYPPEKYNENELDAIKAFTDVNIGKGVNELLHSLPSGIAPEDIQPVDANDTRAQTIAMLDSAINKSKAPENMVVYSILPAQIGELKSGSVFSFKGYRSTTIDLAVALSEAQDGSILQVLIPKGSKGLYVDDYSSSPGEGEFLLPRGSMVTVTGGPSRLRGNVEGQDTQISYYTSELSNN